jgi:hypothetical protein
MGNSKSVFFYISGHGFGHASRTIETINALHRSSPDIRIAVRTSAPAWLFRLTLTAPAELREVQCDTGVVQIDSLRLDEEATIRLAGGFYRDFGTIVEREARVLSEAGASLVVGDIPPLAFAAAASAGIPSVAISNFTWDWIYEDYDAELREPLLLPVIRRAYGSANLFLRLPMWAGFNAITAPVQDLPLVCRRSHRSRQETREGLGLPDGPLVLLSFGGYGARGIDLEALGRIDGYRFVVTEPEQSAVARPRRLLTLDVNAMYSRGWRYEDLVRAVDVVVTKPGYGIIADCAAAKTAILYTSRGRFREYDALVEAMPGLVRSLFIGQDDLLAGRLKDYLDELTATSAPSMTIATNGAEVAARVIERWATVGPGHEQRPLNTV